MAKLTLADEIIQVITNLGVDPTVVATIMSDERSKRRATAGNNYPVPVSLVAIYLLLFIIIYHFITVLNAWKEDFDRLASEIAMMP